MHSRALTVRRRPLLGRSLLILLGASATLACGASTSDSSIATGDPATGGGASAPGATGTGATPATPGDNLDAAQGGMKPLAVLEGRYDAATGLIVFVRTDDGASAGLKPQDMTELTRNTDFTITTTSLCGASQFRSASVTADCSGFSADSTHYGGTIHFANSATGQVLRNTHLVVTSVLPGGVSVSNGDTWFGLSPDTPDQSVPSNVAKWHLGNLTPNVSPVTSRASTDKLIVFTGLSTSTLSSFNFKLVLLSDAVACTPSSSTDTPDTSSVDANCDGVDGDIQDATQLFVLPSANGGSDSTGTGTWAKPYATVTNALTHASSQIIVGGGTYDGAVTLVGGRNLRGGYKNTRHFIGTRDLDGTAPDGSGTAYNSTLTNTSGSNSNTVLLATSSVGSATTVAGFAITAPNASAAGTSSYGMRVDSNSALITFSHVTVTAGTGANGTAGTAGTAGTKGNNGSAGTVGSTSGVIPPGGAAGASVTCADGSTTGAGGTGSDGGDGLDDPDGTAGDADGAAATNGSASSGGAAGAVGTVLGGIGCGSASGCSGTVGNVSNSLTNANGANGTAGTSATASTNIGTLASGATFTVPTAIGTPTSGKPGGGGAGGASGGANNDSNDIISGGSGGGGASGSCGGTAGTSGTAGGASIAASLNNALVTFDTCTLTAQTGGNGGAGGAGGTGGTQATGGARGNGGTVTTFTSGRGQPGGKGGSGGAGGSGAGGAGGPSYAVASHGGTVTVTSSTLNIGTASSGGTGQASNSGPAGDTATNKSL